MWWYRLVVKSTGYRTVRRICQGLCFNPPKCSLAWALCWTASQPSHLFPSPVRDPTLDKVQTTVPCHALFGPSQSVGE